MSLGEGFRVGLWGWQGWFFLWKIEGKGEGGGEGGAGGGGGVGTGKGTGKSMRQLCRNYPLATYPLKSARFLSPKRSCEIMADHAKS